MLCEYNGLLFNTSYKTLELFQKDYPEESENIKIISGNETVLNYDDLVDVLIKGGGIRGYISGRMG